MLDSRDPDEIPTLDEESLDPKEEELLEHWTSDSPQMAMQYKKEGEFGPLAMMARVHLHHIQQKVDQEVFRNPHLSRQEIAAWFDDEMWTLPAIPQPTPDPSPKVTP